MIYTVTFNPSLDYIIKVDNFKTGIINKTSKEEILPGGKGVNVSIVLKNLGLKNIALGFLAGFTGKEIENKIRSYGCETDFIHIDEGISRINIKLKSQEESEINGSGPFISDYYINRLMEKLNLLKEEDILVLAGSIPSGLTEDIYEMILKTFSIKRCRVIVDATGDLLKNSLKYNPFLVKPNNHELGELFDVTLNTRASVIPYAKKLQALGARNVLVSMASKGGVLVDEAGLIYEADAPRDMVVNSVGAGDSMVAGFIYGYLTGSSYEEAFYTGLAAGSASAFSNELATKEKIDQLLSQMRA